MNAVIFVYKITWYCEPALRYYELYFSTLFSFVFLQNLINPFLITITDFFMILGSLWSSLPGFLAKF